MTILARQLTYLTAAPNKVVKILEKLGIELDTEVDFPPNCVDIYLPDYHVGVEVDGPNHSKIKDEERDYTLLNIYQLPIFHIPVEWIANPSYWVGDLIKVIESYKYSKDERWEFCKMRTPWL